MYICMYYLEWKDILQNVNSVGDKLLETQTLGKCVMAAREDLCFAALEVNWPVLIDGIVVMAMNWFHIWEGDKDFYHKHFLAEN